MRPCQDALQDTWDTPQGTPQDDTWETTPETAQDTIGCTLEGSGRAWLESSTDDQGRLVDRQVPLGLFCDETQLSAGRNPRSMD